MRVGRTRREPSMSCAPSTLFKFSRQCSQRLRISSTDLACASSGMPRSANAALPNRNSCTAWVMIASRTGLGVTRAIASSMARPWR